MMACFKKSRYMFCFFNVQKSYWCINYTEAPILLKKLNSIKLNYCTGNSSTQSEKMTKTLKHKFPLAKRIDVIDVSGGCGSMYEIFVESIEFKGLPIVKQHRLINEILKEDIKQMHGLRIQTKVPNENS